MGPLHEILPICTSPLKQGGIFIAFQSQLPHPLPVCEGVRFLQARQYLLPEETTKRQLVVYQKDDK